MPEDTRENGEGEGMLVTETDTPQGLLVTVCDAELLGETFEEGAVSLDVTESFYGGESSGESEVRDALGRASVANLVGARSVDLAIDAGFVEAGNVLEVDETVHAQFLRL